MQKSFKPLVLVLAAVMVSGNLWLDVTAAYFQGPWKAPASAKALKSPLPADANTLAEGKVLYDKNCNMCHGDKGKGDGAMAAMLKEPPPDLGRALKDETDGELFWKISEGRDPMPVFGKKISKEDIWKTVLYSRTLVK